MNNNFKNLIRCILIIILIICVGFTYLNSSIGQKNIINYEQIKNTKKISKSIINNNLKEKTNFNTNLTKNANYKIILNNAFNDKIPVIGVINIPSVNIIDPIINGYGKNGNYLALGACTMKPNQVMGTGNYALAGHYMSSNTIFHNLNKVKIGMYVYLTNMNKIYTYKVYKVTTISEFNVDVINNIPSRNIITLITCNRLDKTKYRILVQGNLIRSSKFNNKKLTIFINNPK